MILIITYILLIFKTALEVDAIIIPLYKQGNRRGNIKVKVTAMEWHVRDLSLGLQSTQISHKPRMFLERKRPASVGSESASLNQNLPYYYYYYFIHLS